MTQLLTLTTKLAPTRKFLVDGEEFEILGLEHLSRDDEAKVVALIARHNVLNEELAVTSQVERGKDLAERIRKTRFQIIETLTTLPREVIDKLPITAQVELLTAVITEEETDDEDAPPGGSADE